MGVGLLAREGASVRLVEGPRALSRGSTAAFRVWRRLVEIAALLALPPIVILFGKIPFHRT